ncbi:FUSC family protein [Brevibacillus ginsengisoli]|uniref:FUSC family protein n=1 Tax=Brevibacillus ginsengisoli TaxID=363854 RepID=UPI003CF4D73A
MQLRYRKPFRFSLTLQIVKTALAAAISWWLTTVLFYNPYPYFAPLAAILTVQVTVADSLEKALQRIVGIVLGVSVSLLFGYWISIGALSIFIVVLIGMVIPNSLQLNTQITSQVAVSSLLVLAFGHHQGYAFGRIIETVIGCAVAIVINAFLIPPNPLPSVETSLLHLSKHAANTLKALVLLFEQKGGEMSGYDEVERLIIETEKSLEAMRLAEQSQKYSPFRAKIRGRLEVLSFGVNQLEKVTVQIRGIRRSLTDLRKMEGYESECMCIERICRALETTADCIEHFGELIIHESAENKEAQRVNVQHVESILFTCLNEMTRIKSPFVLREIGGILSDLNRIVKEVSSSKNRVATRKFF